MKNLVTKHIHSFYYTMIASKPSKITLIFLCLMSGLCKHESHIKARNANVSNESFEGSDRFDFCACDFQSSGAGAEGDLHARGGA